MGGSAAVVSVRAIDRAALLLLVPLAALGTACEDPPSDPNLSVVAYVADEPLYLSDLQRYLDSNLLEVEVTDDLPAESLDEVKSRLLDTLIDERILLAEAVRRGIEVTDGEVDAYLDHETAEPTEQPEPQAWREVEARQRLQIQKLQEEIVLSGQPPTDDEIETYALTHRDELIPARALELRALELGSLDEAQHIHQEIRSRRMTFNEAALVYEATPGQALPQRMSWHTLSEQVRLALEGLAPGEVSRPIELYGAVYLFQISSWLDDPDDQDIELMHRATLALESERRSEALDALLADLRSRSSVRLKEDALPFRYVPVAS